MSTPNVVRPNFCAQAAVLARLTYLEALKDGYVLAAVGVAVLVLGLAVATSEVSMFAHERIVVDFCLSAMALVGLGLSMGVSQLVMARDLRGRGASVLLGRPLGRGVWLLGRWFGVFGLMVTAEAAMAAVFLPAMMLLGIPLHQGLLGAAALVPLECSVALGLSMLVRCVSQKAIAAAAIVVLVLGGYLVDADALSEYRSKALAKRVLGAVASGLPQMQRLSGRPWAAHGEPLPEGFLLYAGLYALGYMAATLSMGTLALGRRRAL